MTEKKPVSDFAKAMQASYQRSKAGTKAAERRNFSQSPNIKPFTPAERAGKDAK